MIIIYTISNKITSSLHIPIHIFPYPRNSFISNKRNGCEQLCGFSGFLWGLCIGESSIAGGPTQI